MALPLTRCVNLKADWYYAAAGVAAAALGARYASPLRSMAQITRAVLFAKAMATTFAGRRSSSLPSQLPASCARLPRITVTQQLQGVRLS